MPQNKIPSVIIEIFEGNNYCTIKTTNNNNMKNYVLVGLLTVHLNNLCKESTQKGKELNKIENENKENI